MDETTQQNAALVEQAAAASQAIVEQAQALNTLIARYKVNDDGHPAARSAGKVAAAPHLTERRGKDRPWSKPAAAPTAPPAEPRTAMASDGEWSEF